MRPSWLNSNLGNRLGIRLEQGDTDDGEVARGDLAKVCVRVLLNETARGKTFKIYNELGTLPTNWSARFTELRPDSVLIN